MPSEQQVMIEDTAKENSQPSRRRITIDPITRLEGHGKIEIFLDETRSSGTSFLPSARVARLREIRAGTSGGGNATDHFPHLRRLPDCAPHGGDQGARSSL